ncbi:MAG: hypothetical protein QM779_13790 [Propionicimonas sp.]|uniref:hypothetical protein n=1 Tax=Propionicimonas sp. TaxID=1955623 RepID=UPI003D12AACA
MQKIVIRAAVVATASLLLAGCSSSLATSPGTANSNGEQRIVSVDGPEFGSVEQLAAEADLVVKGHFGARSEAVTEGALNGGDWEGLPMELWGFVVDEVVAGDETLAGTTIQVSQVTTDVDGAIRPASDGASAVLFLKPYPSGAYAIVGLGAGTIFVDESGDLSVPDDVPATLEKDVEKLTSATVERTIENSFAK